MKNKTVTERYLLEQEANVDDLREKIREVEKMFKNLIVPKITDKNKSRMVKATRKRNQVHTNTHIGGIETLKKRYKRLYAVYERVKKNPTPFAVKRLRADVKKLATDAHKSY